jgi:hypothetical protein
LWKVFRESIVRLFTSVILFALLGACATLGSSRPDWVLQPPKDSGSLYFVGSASGAKTSQEGQEMALKDALGKIANYLGTRIQTSSQQIVNEIEQRLEVQISTKSDAQIKEADVVQWSVNERDSLFDIYTLVRISKSRIREELVRQERDNLAKIEASYGVYSRALDAINLKDFKSASTLLKQAIEMLEPIQGIASSSLGEFTNSRELFVHLKEKLRIVSLARRKISIVLNLPETEGIAEAFMSKLYSILGQKGFTVDESQPTYLISGKVVSRESGFVIGNYVYAAEGSLMVVYVNDGSVAGVIPVTARALGNTKNMSALNTFSSAGKKAGDDLTDFLLSFEEE